MIGFTSGLTQQIVALQNELAPLKEIFNALNRHMAVIEFGIDGIIRSANDLFGKTMGYDPAQLVGTHHRTFCEKGYADSEDYRDFWARLKRGESFNGKFRRVRKDHTTAWLEATYFPVAGPDGQIDRVIKIASDITARVEEASHTRGLIEALNRSMAVIEFDMQGQILDANAPFLETMGYSRNDLIGRHHRIFCGADYAASTAYDQFWRNLNAGKFFSGLVERRSRHGDAIWLEATYNPILDESGKPYRVVKFASDVTERVLRSQAERQSANTAYEISLEAEKLSAQGETIIQQTVQQMRSISNQVGQSSSQVGGLGEKTNQITSIVNTIRGIADQTNLLALNAAIEAARAGESGRGFAVVADEVRGLAARTSNSTGDISRMIDEIQIESRNVIESMSRSLADVEVGVKLVNDAGAAINQIHQGASRVVQVIQELSDSVSK